MDERFLTIREEDYQNPLPISDDHGLYRQVHFQQLEKGKRYPMSRHFKYEEDGMSMHWDQYATVETVYHQIGLTYKVNKQAYKKPADFSVFRFPVSLLRTIEGISRVIHSPHLTGNPAPIGSPNNFAHASVVTAGDLEEVRLKLADYCNELFDVAYCTVDMDMIVAEINALREKGDQTVYHKCLP